MKKLLLLGAVPTAVPLIEKAKEDGIFVISCDYLPDNPGHCLADESYYESTTDIPAVLNLASEKQIDGILSFNSDVSAYTAAVVAKELSLPGNDPEVIDIFTQKNKFRNFLKEHHFNVPQFSIFSSEEQLLQDLDKIEYPVIVKPTDLSGSKGVFLVKTEEQLVASAKKALEMSRSHTIIVEDFIELLGPQLHGDGYVEDGELKFACLGDHHFGAKIDNFVPYSTTFPSVHKEEEIGVVMSEVARCVSESGLRNAMLNIEARICAKDRKVYIMEIGPRNGGNFTPRIIEKFAGVDFDRRAISYSLGQTYDEKKPAQYVGNWAYLVIHADEKGLFERIDYSSELSSLIVEEWLFVRNGDTVEPFVGGNKALGVLILRADSASNLLEIVENCTKYYSVVYK